jgi:flavin-dependent dehydrogenase
MKKFVYSMAALAGLAAAMAAAPASANVSVTQMDQYGCRWESRSYVCYQGMFAGRRFVSQEEMMRNARIVPVYIDDSGAPRSMPPFASRGNEKPPTDAGTMEEQINLF